MSTVAIITDSTACIPPALAAELEIRIVPLFLEFEDETYQDGLPGTAASFYEKLAAAKEPPTTGAPSPGAYADAMVETGKSAAAVLCITVSRQFSGMYDAAVQGMELARERAPELNLRVLDSQSAAMGQGFVALEAARAAKDGATGPKVLARAQAVSQRVRLLIGLDTLTYLGRSGRVPRLLLWASSPLRIKPVVSFAGGSYRPVGFARSRPRLMESLCRALEKHRISDNLHVCVHHTNAPEAAAELLTRVRDEFEPAELFISEFTQLMGIHTGPGLLGFAFFTDSRQIALGS